MKIKQSSLRLLIREAIEQVFEAETQYQVGDRVKIDSSYGGGIGTVEMARHPFYAIKFDQTGTTDSFHFSDLRPFNDEEEDKKDADIDTHLDENSKLYIVKQNPQKERYDVLRNGNLITYFDTEEKAQSHVSKLNKRVASWEKLHNLHKGELDESSNPTDSITLDVPLFIRMLEYAREDAKTDMDLHNVTENALKLSIEGKTLTMSDYDSIVGGESLDENAAIAAATAAGIAARSIGHHGGEVPSNPWALLAVGVALSIPLIGIALAGTDTGEKIISWWEKKKLDHNLNRIVTKLRNDPEVLEFIKSKKPGIQSLLKSKLDPEDQKYVKNLSWNVVTKGEIKEASMDKIYHITGTLVVDDEKRNQKDILSDVRALPGVTIVRNIEMEQDPSSRYFRSTIEIKIDPYPYAKQGKFNDGTIQTVINNVKGINGVIGFKQTEDTYSTND